MLAVASCRRARQDERPRNATGGAKDLAEVRTHWVQDERLRGVMAEISRQAQHWPAGVPDDVESPATAESKRAFADAVALADGLARAARDIPRAVADREMTSETRRGFNAEARHLRDQAVQLKDAARSRSVERMQRLLDGISSSCISCHSQYRDFTGELGTRRASLE
jgi:hypothetical protein